MSKAFCIAGMIVAGLLLVFFLLDLSISLPFGRASWLFDVVMILCAAGLGFLSWTVWKEQV